MNFTPFTQAEKAFTCDLHSTIAFLNPPLPKKGFAKEVERRIKNLIASNPFSSNEILKDLLEQAAGDATRLKNRDPIVRVGERITLRWSLTSASNQILRGIPAHVFSALTAESIGREDEKLWEMYGVPAKYQHNDLLSEAVINCRIERIRWLAAHSCDMNNDYIHNSYPALFTAARNTLIDVPQRINTVKTLIDCRANPMSRNMKGEWHLSAVAIQIAPSVFQLMVESVTDMSLARGKVWRSIDKIFLYTDALQEMFRRSLSLENANILISHGLDIPKWMQQGWKEGLFQQHWMDHRQELLKTQDLRKRFFEEEFTETRTKAQTEILACTPLPNAVVLVIADYFLLNDQALRIQVSRRTLAAIEADKKAKGLQLAEMNS